MYLVKKIVVGVEMPPTQPWKSSEVEAPSLSAIRHGQQLAQAAGIPLTLVTVVPEHASGWFSSSELEESASQQLQSEALAVLKELAGEPDGELAVECAVRTGRPWLELLRAANGAADTLIICGTRNTKGLSRALFGSTGLKLLRNARGPVWLVKPIPDQDEIADILAATDLTDVGQEILLTAVSLAKTLPARLHVLHVVDNNIDRYLRRTGMPPEQLEQMRIESRNRAEAAVHEQLAKTDFRTLQYGVQVHIAEGPPDVLILESLQRLNINILLIATKARGGVAGMLIGNTAEKLLPEIPCSIIAIKPDDFVSPVQPE